MNYLYNKDFGLKPKKCASRIFQNFWCVKIASVLLFFLIVSLIPTSALALLQAPELVSPGSGSAPGPDITTTTPQLKWKSELGVAKYGVYISEYPYGPANQIYANESISSSSTSFQVPSGKLQNGKKYRWKAASFNSAGQYSLSNPLYLKVLTSADLISTYRGFSPKTVILGSTSWNYYSGFKNRGGSAANPSRADVYISSDTNFTTTDYKIGSINVPPLGAGEGIPPIDLNISTFPSNIPAGSYYVGILVDAGKAVSESDENNWFYDLSQMLTLKSACTDGVLSGKVFDAVTNSVLSGVTVNISNGLSDVTNSSGYYVFPTIATNTYTISVSTGSYQSYYQSVYICGNKTQDIYLTKSSTVYGDDTQSGYSKDPVNTATGNYIYSRKDLEIPGPGIDFMFEPNYNSQAGSDPAATDGPLGYGWSHNYNVTLAVNTSVTITWGDGKTETWTPDGSGGFTPQYGVFDTLTDNGDGTYTLKKKDLTKYNFDTSGRLSGIVDKNGNTITLTYTGSNLTQITDTAGRTINLTYDTNNHIALITDPIGRTIRFTYDANDNLVSAKDMSGNTTAYTYDNKHQILTVVDPRGNTVVTNVYDSLNRVVNTQKDAKGGQTTYTYDEVNRKTTITDALGNTTIHYYDEFLRLIQETDGGGNSAFYTCDSAGNRTEVKDKNGNITNYSYDDRGNVTKKIEPLGSTTTITYDSNNNPLTRTDDLGNVTTYEYDANGNLIKTIDPLGNFTTTTYNAKGQPLTTTDGRGNTTNYKYDTQGNLIEVTDPSGNKTTYTYDGVGRRKTIVDALSRTTTYNYDNNDNLISVKDHLNNTTAYTYDENNNRVTMKDPLGNITSYSYDEKDLLVTIKDPLLNSINYTYDSIGRKLSETDKRGNTTNYAYDEAGNLIKVTDALGNQTTYTYDANGNKLTETNPLGQTTTYTYDALNRVVSITDPLGNITTNIYDSLGRVVATTNAKGQTTGFEYDKLGRLTKVTDDNNGTVQYAYDENGNRISMVDPNGNITNYSYDKLNRLIMKTEPLNNTTQYQYDEVGNLKQTTDPNGNTVQYNYDALNRLTTKTYPDNTTVTFEYDANGNRIKMIDSLGTTSYQYDKLNRMTSCTDSFNKTVGYGYDANGNRTSITYPDNKVVNYTYDKLNRLATVTDWLTNTTSYTYDATGNLINTSNPNNTTVTYTYDAAGRLTGLINKKSDSTVISSYSYTLDEIGNHTQSVQEEPLVPVIPDQNVNYTYDTENRLTDVSGTANTFDANGNMTGKGSDTYTYDYEDRLIQSAIGGAVTQYSYDGNGNRLVKVEGSNTTRYVLDINGSLSNVLAETDGSGNITAYYVYGLGLISKILPDDTASYYHYDSRGSTIALTDLSENITDKYAYGPFGKLANSTGSTTNPFKYVGRYGVQDEENGLQYIRARYYASELGRFVTKDTLAGNDKDGQSLNRYVYALNNPVVLIDISGFSAQEGGNIQNNFGTSDLLNGELVDGIDRIKYYKAQARMAELDYVAALQAESAYWEAWANTLEGANDALGTVRALFVSGPSGAISGLLGQLSTLADVTNHQRVANILNTANFVVSSYDLLNSSNELNTVLDKVDKGKLSFLSNDFLKQSTLWGLSAKGWWNSLKGVPVNP